MEDQKSDQLFESVLSKTKAGKLVWETTADEDVYFATISGHFILRLWRSKSRVAVADFTQPINTYLVPDIYGLDVRDKDGREILIFSSDSPGRTAELIELFGLARQQALGLEAQVDSVLNELARL